MQWFDIKDKRPEQQQDIIVQLVNVTATGKIDIRIAAGRYEANMRTVGRNDYGSLEVQFRDKVYYIDFDEWIPAPKVSPKLFVK